MILLLAPVQPRQIKVQRLIKDVDVLLQPLREVISLMSPNLSEMNALEFSNGVLM